MKNHLEILKWQLKQVKPFILSIIIVVFLGTFLSLCGVGIAVLSKYLIDYASEGEWSFSLSYLFLFALLIIIQILLQSFSSIISSRTNELLSNRIRKESFEHISRAYWLDINSYHSGDILTRLTSDVAVVSNALVNAMPHILTLIVRIAAAFLALMFFDPVLALLAFILGPITVLFSRYWAKKLKKYHIKAQEHESVYRSFINDCLQNLTTVKSFCAEKECSEKMDRLQGERMHWSLRRKRIETMSGSILSIGYWAGYFLAFIWGIAGLSKGAATFGTLAAFLQLVEQLQSPFTELTFILPHFVSAEASAERLMEFEKLRMEEIKADIPSWSSVGIKFDNVSFAYPNSDLLLKDISFSISPSETVALTGKSGEGKTTLVRLMLTLLQPDKGKILLTNKNGEELEVCPSYRNLIAYVPQGNTAFSGTIAENLRIGFPGATDKDLEDALHAACAWDFVKTTPKGLYTEIGERGLGLSDGQAQRIALARAFLRKSQILILDEATSELDIETEEKILSSINAFNPGQTCIIITHRMAALEKSDKILAIEKGSLVELNKSVT